MNEVEESKRNLILIPARSGSTRVKNKNIRALAGRPLLSYVVDAAAASRGGRVVVSTNSQHIREIALDLGAEAPFLRPESLATSTASSISALVHALKWLKDEQGFDPALVAFCPPTNPFTSPATIRNMLAELDRNPKFNSITTVTTSRVHPFGFVTLDKDGSLRIDAVTVDGKNANNVERSQDMPRFLLRCANCVITRVAHFKDVFGEDYGRANPGHIHTFDVERCLGYEIGTGEAMDIDTMEDFEDAEIAAGSRGRKSSDAGPGGGVR